MSFFSLSKPHPVIVDDLTPISSRDNNVAHRYLIIVYNVTYRAISIKEAKKSKAFILSRYHRNIHDNLKLFILQGLSGARGKSGRNGETGKQVRTADSFAAGNFG